MAEKQQLLLRCVVFVIFVVSILVLMSCLNERPAWQRLEKGNTSRDNFKCLGLCKGSLNSTVTTSTSNSSSSNTSCPAYFGLIRSDLLEWELGGITEAMLEDSVHLGASMRVSIVAGKLYIQVYGDCPQSRPMFTIWGLLMLLEKYPGRQIPDVEFMINCKDCPIVSGVRKPPPVFSYCRNNKSHDILIPDYSYWGWPEVKVDPWELQSKEIFSQSQGLVWKDRKLSAFWRGNSRMGRIRKFLLGCNSGDEAELYDQNWASQSAFEPSAKLSQQCKNRYNIYAEGAAWSASLKYRMACGSTMLYINSDYYDFFSRALIPGVHYLPVPSNVEEMCQSLREQVHWGNSHPDEAEIIGKNGRSFMEEELSMERVYDYLFQLLSAYAKLQRFTPRVRDDQVELCPEAIQCIATENSKSMLAKTPVPVLRLEPPCIQRAFTNFRVVDARVTSSDATATAC